MITTWRLVPFLLAIAWQGLGQVPPGMIARLPLSPPAAYGPPPVGVGISVGPGLRPPFLPPWPILGDGLGAKIVSIVGNAVTPIIRQYPLIGGITRFLGISVREPVVPAPVGVVGPGSIAVGPPPPLAIGAFGPPGPVVAGPPPAFGQGAPEPLPLRSPVPPVGQGPPGPIPSGPPPPQIGQIPPGPLLPGPPLPIGQGPPGPLPSGPAPPYGQSPPGPIPSGLPPPNVGQLPPPPPPRRPRLASIEVGDRVVVDESPSGPGLVVRSDNNYGFRKSLLLPEAKDITNTNRDIKPLTDILKKNIASVILFEQMLRNIQQRDALKPPEEQDIVNQNFTMPKYFYDANDQDLRIYNLYIASYARLLHRLKYEGLPDMPPLPPYPQFIRFDESKYPGFLPLAREVSAIVDRIQFRHQYTATVPLKSENGPGPARKALIIQKNPDGTLEQIATPGVENIEDDRQNRVPVVTPVGGPSRKALLIPKYAYSSYKQLASPGDENIEEDNQSTDPVMTLEGGGLRKALFVSKNPDGTFEQIATPGVEGPSARKALLDERSANGIYNQFLTPEEETTQGPSRNALLIPKYPYGAYKQHASPGDENIEEDSQSTDPVITLEGGGLRKALFISKNPDGTFEQIATPGVEGPSARKALLDERSTHGIYNQVSTPEEETTQEPSRKALSIPKYPRGAYKQHASSGDENIEEDGQSTDPVMTLVGGGMRKALFVSKNPDGTFEQIATPGVEGPSARKALLDERSTDGLYNQFSTPEEETTQEPSRKALLIPKYPRGAYKQHASPGDENIEENSQSTDPVMTLEGGGLRKALFISKNPDGTFEQVATPGVEGPSARKAFLDERSAHGIYNQFSTPAEETTQGPSRKALLIPKYPRGAYKQHASPGDENVEEDSQSTDPVMTLVGGGMRKALFVSKNPDGTFEQVATPGVEGPSARKALLDERSAHGIYNQFSTPEEETTQGPSRKALLIPKYPRGAYKQHASPDDENIKEDNQSTDPVITPEGGGLRKALFVSKNPDGTFEQIATPGVEGPSARKALLDERNAHGNNQFSTPEDETTQGPLRKALLIQKDSNGGYPQIASPGVENIEEGSKPIIPGDTPESGTSRKALFISKNPDGTFDQIATPGVKGPLRKAFFIQRNPNGGYIQYATPVVENKPQETNILINLNNPEGTMEQIATPGFEATTEYQPLRSIVYAEGGQSGGAYAVGSSAYPTSRKAVFITKNADGSYTETYSPGTSVEVQSPEEISSSVQFVPEKRKGIFRDGGRAMLGYKYQGGPITQIATPEEKGSSTESVSGTQFGTSEDGSVRIRYYFKRNPDGTLVSLGSSGVDGTLGLNPPILNIKTNNGNTMLGYKYQENPITQIATPEENGPSTEIHSGNQFVKSDDGSVRTTYYFKRNPDGTLEKLRTLGDVKAEGGKTTLSYKYPGGPIAQIATTEDDDPSVEIQSGNPFGKLEDGSVRTRYYFKRNPDGTLVNIGSSGVDGTFGLNPPILNIKTQGENTRLVYKQPNPIYEQNNTGNIQLTTSRDSSRKGLFIYKNPDGSAIQINRPEIHATSEYKPRTYYLVRNPDGTSRIQSSLDISFQISSPEKVYQKQINSRQQTIDRKYRDSEFQFQPPVDNKIYARVDEPIIQYQSDFDKYFSQRKANSQIPQEEENEDAEFDDYTNDKIEPVSQTFRKFSDYDNFDLDFENDKKVNSQVRTQKPITTSSKLPKTNLQESTKLLEALELDFKLKMDQIELDQRTLPADRQPLHYKPFKKPTSDPNGDKNLINSVIALLTSDSYRQHGEDIIKIPAVPLLLLKDTPEEANVVRQLKPLVDRILQLRRLIRGPASVNLDKIVHSEQLSDTQRKFHHWC